MPPPPPGHGGRPRRWPGRGYAQAGVHAAGRWPPPCLPPRTRPRGLRLQIHDELLFEVDAAQLQAAARLVKRLMEGVAAVFGLSVPLPVKLSAGPSWGALQPLQLPHLDT